MTRPMLDRIRDILAADGIAQAASEAAQILEVAAGDDSRALALAEQRAGGAPLGYVLGRRTFMGIDLLVAPGVLVPREETEILGRRAVAKLKESGGARVIDMCCGAGNLVCAIAVALPEVRAWASDLTDGSVKVARQNVTRLELTHRVTIAQGDLFAPLRGLGLHGTIDMIVCNPPYISTGRLAKDRAGLLEHEPREAFDGGPYGLSIHQRVIKDALEYLAPAGWLLFEVGVGQERQVTRLFDRAGQYCELELVNDAADIPRVVAARKARPPA